MKSFFLHLFPGISSFTLFVFLIYVTTVLTMTSLRKNFISDTQSGLWTRYGLPANLSVTTNCHWSLIRDNLWSASPQCERAPFQPAPSTWLHSLLLEDCACEMSKNLVDMQFSFDVRPLRGWIPSISRRRDISGKPSLLPGREGATQRGRGILSLSETCTIKNHYVASQSHNLL